MSKNISELSGRKGLGHNLFEELGKASDSTGTPSMEQMESLREEFLVGKSSIYGTVSFYDFLKPENKGRKVYICNGSACMTAGTQDELKKSLRKKFSAEEIGEMCCLGRCHENSAFHISGRNYSGEDILNLDQIASGEAATAEKYHRAHIGTPILTAPYPPPDSYYSIFTSALSKEPRQILEELKLSGLRGRGGAGFSTAFKLESCKKSEGDLKFIVCNADKGDPGAYSDRYIMEQRPHALLLGMMIAAYITGARWGVLYIRAEYPESIDVISQSVDYLASIGLIGDDILGSGFNFRFKIIKAQGAYICGEETALLSSIEGQRPEVRIRPPFPTQQGLFNMPTVVNNVETLACIPWIMNHGGQKYAGIGKGKSTGTKLVSLDGFFHKPGIYEVDMGTPLSVVTETLGGGFRKPVKAMHIGGPLGGLVPVSSIPDLTVDFETFAQHGFLLGHASVVCIPESYPMVEYIKHLFKFTAHESCGKCFPCRLGSTRGYELLHKATEEGYRIEMALMQDLLDTLEAGSLCALGGGLPLPVKNALHYFREELEEYFIHT